MRKINKKPIFLAAIALIFVLTLSIGSAMAYFTTYTMTSGEKTMELGYTTTEIHENVINSAKHITIVNTGDYDCFVRVKVYADSAVENTINISGEQGWEPGTEQDPDGRIFWNYTQVLEPQATTSELLVEFKFPEGTDLTEAQKQFNIVVVHECTPAIYDNADHASVDWDNVVSVSE